jgi:YidC/Oxa1 family membrane protein insertase
MLEIEIQNLSQSVLTIDYPLAIGVLNFAGPNQAQGRFQDIVVSDSEKISHPNAQKDQVFQKIKFVGLRDRYFCMIVEPKEPDYSGYVKKLAAHESEIGIRFPDLKVQPGQNITSKFHIYLGPQDLASINKVDPDWTAVMYYGTFDFISNILLQILQFIFNLVHNWGVAIIILSVLIYLILFPLSAKQMNSMKKLQALQPKIEQLRKAHKDNPQKLNKETLELYKLNKVNPFGGCLPMLLQLPIFFALYQALIRSISLKGAGFLWIKDLSEPDKLFTFPTALPIIGNEFNILPILMAIGMFVQQKLSMASAAASDSAAEQQKMMLILMPVLFGFIFYHMASGLVLYWFVNSVLMLAYQLRTTFSK